jgi:hypothetical protein
MASAVLLLTGALLLAALAALLAALSRVLLLLTGLLILPALLLATLLAALVLLILVRIVHRTILLALPLTDLNVWIGCNVPVELCDGARAGVLPRRRLQKVASNHPEAEPIQVPRVACSGRGLQTPRKEPSMQSKKLALAVLASAFMSTTALAQANPPAEKAPMTPPAKSMTAPSAKDKDSAKPMDSSAKPMDASKSASAAVVNSAQGQWRASKLIGVDVYNAANEKIGDINELITGADGKIDTVVVGVGGFLGIGEHNVGIAFDQVKFSDQPVKSSTTGTGSAAASADKDYPDHAMVNMTKDQLKALPAFKYASDTSSTATTRPATSPAPAARPAAPATPPAGPANPPAK